MSHLDFCEAKVTMIYRYAESDLRMTEL